jgi:hypothetical protein
VPRVHVSPHLAALLELLDAARDGVEHRTGALSQEVAEGRRGARLGGQLEVVANDGEERGVGRVEAQEHVDERLDQPPHAFAARAARGALPGRPGEDVPALLGDGGQPAGEDLAVEALLVGEVVVDEGLLDAGRARDAPEARPFEPLGGELRLGGGEEAGLGRVRAPFAGNARPSRGRGRSGIQRHADGSHDSNSMTPSSSNPLRT